MNVDNAGDTKTQPKPDPNTNPSVAQNTFLKTAMEDAVNNGHDLPTIDVSNILGRTFITTPDHEGEQKHAKIKDGEFLQQRTADEMEPLLRFKCKVGEERFEQILTYNRMLQWCKQDKDKGEFFRLVAMEGHRKQASAKGGWQVLVRWASGLTGWNNLSDTFDGDPITLALHAKKNNLLELPSWRRCKRYAKQEKVIGRMINQVCLKHFRNRPRYKYGIQVPRNHN